jgi:hypothetical protein
MILHKIFIVSNVVEIITSYVILVKYLLTYSINPLFFNQFHILKEALS